MFSSPLTLTAPAKLNLFLHITGRRNDGYHELQTIFQLLDFGDQLTFNHAKSGTLELSSNLPELANNDNLISKAVKLLESHCQRTLPIHIHLEKVLPMGGGIGGGSSDCATTILALNLLYELNLSEQTLLTLGNQLGADVPVFIGGKTAWAEGTGDQLTPMQMPQQWFVVIHPTVHVSTPELFAHPQLTRNSPISTIRPALAQTGHNDFEPLVRKLYPIVEEAFNACAPYGNARLTGSGSCLFLKVPDEMTAKSVSESIHTDHPNLNTFAAKGSNISTTRKQLDQFQNR